MPSQIKVDEIKNVAGQYEIKTNTFKGQTTGGSIAVQGEGTSTTNLQQGLSKAWYQLDGTGTIGMNDSFNMTTTTDHGTGEYTTTFTNAMSNDDYAFLFGSASQANIGSNGATTTTLRLRCRDGSNSALDLDPITCGVNGDLA